MTYLLAPLLGAIYCLGFAPFDLWPATLIAIAGLFYALLHTSRPVLFAWLFGIGRYGLGTSWIYVSIHVHGNAPPGLAASLVVLFSLGMALFFIPLGWAFYRWRVAQGTAMTNVWLFVALWLVIEWLLTWFLTGFPWLLAGYGFMQTPLMGLAPIVGVLGISAAVTIVAAAAVVLFLRRRWQWGPIVLITAPWIIGLVLQQIEWVRPTNQHSVALVQGNLEQSRKWLAEQQLPNLRRHLELSQPHWDADLVVWPEAAITFYAHQRESLIEQINQQARATETNLVTGIPGVTFDSSGDYTLYNLSMGLGLAEGEFAKRHLVPFGEYVPLESLLRGLIEFFDLPMSRSSPGPDDQANIGLSLGEAAMALCYEVSYPESMRRQAASAAVLITLTNDTWFGDSIGPPQHMQIAQMRAAENGRWLLRAANNGITGIVDHRGREIEVLPQFKAGVLRGSFAVMDGRTPYSYIGLWPLYLFVLGVAIWSSTRSLRE